MNNRLVFVYQLKHNGNKVYLNEGGYTTELVDAAMFSSLAQAVDFIWNIPIEKYVEMGLDDVLDEQKKHLVDLRLVVVNTELLLVDKEV